MTNPKNARLGKDLSSRPQSAAADEVEGSAFPPRVRR